MSSLGEFQLLTCRGANKGFFPGLYRALRILSRLWAEAARKRMLDNFSMATASVWGLYAKMQVAIAQVSKNPDFRASH